MCYKKQLWSVFLVSAGIGLLLSVFLESGLLRILLAAILIVSGLACTNKK